MLEVEQGSVEWKAARLGNATASRMADLMAKTKSGYSASRGNLMAALIVERLTGVPMETYTNAAMQHGLDYEDEARSAYEFYIGVPVEKASYVPHPTIEHSGASPDGLIGTEGLLEIKCPNTATHIETLLNGGADRKYILQMQWQMACTDRKWCDFASYDPRVPANLKLYVERVPRNDELISEMSAEVVKFLSELEQKLSKLEALNI